jgi:hypothetical protein
MVVPRQLAVEAVSSVAASTWTAWPGSTLPTPPLIKRGDRRTAVFPTVARGTPQDDRES